MKFLVSNLSDTEALLDPLALLYVCARYPFVFVSFEMLWVPSTLRRYTDALQTTLINLTRLTCDSINPHIIPM